MATETHWRSTLIALSSDRFLSILFKAIQLCQVLCVQNGHEHVLCVVGWCVDSLPDLLSDLKLYSDPEPPCPPVNVVTSLCCECEYQHLPPSAHSPPFVYLCIYLFLCFLLVVYIVNLCLRLLKISWTPVFYFFMFFSGTIFETFFFTIYGQLWRFWSYLNGVLFIEYPIYIKKYI